MRKLEAFSRCLEVLMRADRIESLSSEIYRMGVIGQFNLTFELAWKAVKEFLELHGISNFKTGSPREILKTAYQFNFLGDENIWLDMLKSRNTIAHMYDEAAATALANAIFDSYIEAFANLRDSLIDKTADAENDTF